MALNIKNQEAYDLAAELSQITGKSMTIVVINALRQNLDQVRRKQNSAQRAKELLGIGRRLRERLREPIHSSDPAEMLYDENGMPK